MKISTYTEKLNKVEGNVYVIEEEVSLADGVYEAPLAHDNVNPSTLAVYTGPKLTGERIQSYALSTPSLMPWKRLIRIYTDVPTVYISYETDGDTVEAEDVNLLQQDVIRTQEGLNDEKDRAEAEEALLKEALAEETARAEAMEKKLTTDPTAEIGRAKAEEKKVAADLGKEVDRATAAEKHLTDSLVEETTRATMAEKVLTDNLSAEVIRAKAGEKTVADNLVAETARAKTREDGIAAELAAENIRALNAENALAEDLTIETIRAMAVEKTLTDNLAGETARAEAKETEISGNLSSEITRAKAAEKTLTDNITAEVTRAKGAEKTLTDNLAAEVTRSKGAEKTLTDNLSAEVTRAKAAEKTNADAITAEASRGQAAEGAIRDTVNAHLNNKSNPHGVTKAQAGLGNVPNVTTNDQTPTFTQAATLTNIASGEKLTVMLGKIAKVLADFIAHKADQVIHITAAERTNWNDANGKKHSHSNKTVIDKITQALLDNWSAAYVHISDAVKHITAAERTNWNAAHTHVSNKSNPHGVTAAQAGAAPASHTHSYLPLSGGTMTGELKMKAGDYTAIPIKLYAGDVNGAGLVSQAGGLYIAGSGESAQNLYTAMGTGAATEKTYITSDQDISLVTNCQTIANRKTVIIDNAGKITAPGGFSGAHNPADLSSAVPVSKGGTGATTAAAARTNLGAAASSHTHTKSQITDMPTKVSQFTNDKGYITQSDVDTSQNHTHSNKTVLDKITQALLDTWSGKAGTSVATQTANGLMAAADKKKLDGVAANANNYVHPATAGNKHIPAGGASGQFLKWSADGTAVWAADNNTTYSAFKAATASAAGGTGLVPAPAAGAQAKYLRADGTWQTPTDTTYSDMKGATASAAGTHGLVPAPVAGAQGKYLRADGTWQTPPDTNTTYGAATQTAAGLMPAADKKKLDGVAAGANNYVHPSTHSASMITQDATHRFTSDTEKNGWNKFLFSAAITVPASGWSAGAPYTQTVSVSGLTSAMDVMLTLNITGSPNTDQVKAWKAALGMIDVGTTADGLVTFTCYSKKPAVDLPLYIKSV